ncbi:hypothetical protein KA005_53440 [bacterium]|nr:hypothetical protein [bacterium]
MGSGGKDEKINCNFLKRFIITSLVLGILSSFNLIYSENYYVAPYGDDNNPGTSSLGLRTSDISRHQHPKPSSGVLPTLFVCVVRKNGLITRQTESWPDNCNAPEWRRPWV